VLLLSKIMPDLRLQSCKCSCQTSNFPKILTFTSRHCTAKIDVWDMQMYFFQDSPWNHTYECYVVQYRSQWSKSWQDVSA
jgi:hypothetical protein